MTYDGRMDDNLTAVLMLATLEAMIVAVTWFICRARVKVKRLEREHPPVPPEEWEDFHRWAQRRASPDAAHSRRHENRRRELMTAPIVGHWSRRENPAGDDYESYVLAMADADKMATQWTKKWTKGQLWSRLRGE